MASVPLDGKVEVAVGYIHPIALFQPVLGTEGAVSPEGQTHALYRSDGQQYQNHRDERRSGHVATLGSGDQDVVGGPPDRVREDDGADRVTE